MSDSPSPMLLIDSYAQIYRGYYAIRSLMNSSGEPSNAVFAMMKFLFKLAREFNDSDGAFVFDKGNPPHRMKLAPLYKANRTPMPDELRVQLPIINELITAFGWKIIIFENWEADDLIAAITDKFSEKKIFIISADKDLSQLVDERVEMLVPDQTGKGMALRGVKEVQEKFGVPPNAIVDYLALTGDSSDNIPGIEGVGSKTAAQLIAQFKSIEEMLANAEQITKDKLREKLINGAETLRKNIELVKLIRVPPENSDWTEKTFARSKMDFSKIRGIIQKFEFRSLLGELDALEAVHDKKTPIVQSSEMEQPELF